jgi:hypothetical protein
MGGSAGQSCRIDTPRGTLSDLPLDDQTPKSRIPSLGLPLDDHKTQTRPFGRGGVQPEQNLSVEMNRNRKCMSLNKQ